MKQNTCVVKLPGVRNYAVIVPGSIFFGLGASKLELNGLIEEAHTETYVPTEVEEVAFSAIALIPTFDCNQRCIYCYSRGGESREILPLETAKAAIRDLKNTEARDVIKIHLVGGGEPLLNGKWLVELSEYAKQLFEVVEFHIVSNGTFGNDVLQWIYENQCMVRISYDGIMHTQQRPLASGRSGKSLIQRNIRELVSHSIPIMVQCIVTSQGLNTLRATVDEIVSLGVDVIKFEAARATDVSRFVDGIEPDPEEYARALLDVIVYVGNSHPNVMIDTGYFSEPSENVYCGICGNNTILTPEGLITACLEVSRPTDPYSKEIIFGAIRDGAITIDRCKLDYLATLNYTNEIGGCLRCNLRLICHGGCPMEGIWEHGFPLRKSSYTCKVEHSLLPKLLLLLAENPELANVLVDNVEVFC